MSYPFRYYGTNPDDEQEIIHRVLLAGVPDPDLRDRIIALLPGPPGQQVDDREAFAATLAAALEPGLVHSLWHDRWLITFQDLGEPTASADDALMWRQAFERVHELAPLEEVVALTGTRFDGDPDDWSAWSLSRRQPALGPALGFTRGTPYGDLEA